MVHKQIFGSIILLTMLLGNSSSFAQEENRRYQDEPANTLEFPGGDTTFGELPSCSASGEHSSCSITCKADQTPVCNTSSYGYSTCACH